MNTSTVRLIFSIAILAFAVCFLNACETASEGDPKSTPSITGISPSSGTEGDTVVIAGKNFSENKIQNEVKFNGTSAVIIEATTSKLTVIVPQGASTGKITVSISGEVATSTNNFTVINFPSISSFSPESGETGDEVTIFGENFSATASDNLVKFNGTTATVNSASTTKLTVTVPEEATTGKLVVSVKGQTASSVEVFTIISKNPSIGYIFPTSGVEGDEISIHGENFSAVASENIVKFNGIRAQITKANASFLEVVVPAGATTGKVTVVVNEQMVASTSDFKVFPVQHIKQLAAGARHSLILMEDNTLWGTGSNFQGQLGNGVSAYINVPEQIMQDVKAVATSGDHTLILKEDNTLWATGTNGFGQLGDGTTTDISTPKQIMEGVEAVGTGEGHTMILKEDHTLWATGYNNNGQLGDGTTADTAAPKQIMEGVKAIAAGAYFTLILKEDNTLWGTGDNSFGQLGNGTLVDVTTPIKIMESVKAVAAGGYHTLILKEDNTLWTAGRNEGGQAGDGSTDNEVITPEQIMEGVKAIAAGSNLSLMLKEDNTLWISGRNDEGQIGDGTTTNARVPVEVMPNTKLMAAGGKHTLVFRENGTLWAAGYNQSGQLGDGTYTNTSQFVRTIFK